ncbi:MAG: NTP transferase domain-containing protein, partial [Fibrobacter sp.]|nr:NTP transferase domain-containing protein [Fibrobacter sp.]
MPVHCIVPARMGSSRFPGKPLVKIGGKEMIVRTLERARLAGCFERIVCATDSEQIAEVVSKAEFEYVMTGACATGSDRVAEAARALDLDLVVNLQGDEPLVEPSVLCDVARELEA